ncbi:hypothetical protein EON63_06190 [archaeon]|nr:MAG: hypothetical protein EON63_06190 [archaeon]
MLHKWKRHYTIQDLPKTGRPPILDDRTKRRLAEWPYEVMSSPPQNSHKPLQRSTSPMLVLEPPAIYCMVKD